MRGAESQQKDLAGVMGQRTAWKADSCTAELSPEPPGSIRIGDATAASPPHDGRPDSPVSQALTLQPTPRRILISRIRKFCTTLGYRPCRPC
eukprot:COSAG04_NODE_608_length_12095_cov_54.626709_5_plen_92_part_00